MNYIDTVVIGAGQAGLAVGHELAVRQVPFVILEADARVGDGWRRHWDSLRLFTPGRFSSLPGFPSPVGHSGRATKDEFAEYLESYASRNGIAVRTGVSVLSVAVFEGGFEVATSVGPLSARRVVVASGPHSEQWVPEFAVELDPGIRQLHSSEYRNPAQLPAGDVLVVGAGASGVQIALELALTRRVVLAGRPTPHIPDAVFRFAGGLYWWFVSNVLTVDTPPGRRVAKVFGSRGAPLISVSMKQVDAAGIERRPRITGGADGLPVAGESGPVPVSSVIWATGYRPDVSWLPPLRIAHDGIPVTRRGIVDDLPGLYFVGMPFQYALTSGLIGGVGRDAAFVADRIVATMASDATKTTLSTKRLD